MIIVEQIDPKSATGNAERDHWSPSMRPVNPAPRCKLCGELLVAAPEVNGEMIELGCKTEGCPNVGEVLRHVPVRIDHVERLGQRPTNRGLHDRGLGSWLDETNREYKRFVEQLVMENNPAVDLSTDKGSIDFVARYRDLINRTRVDDHFSVAASNEDQMSRWAEACVSFTDWIFGLEYFLQVLCVPPVQPVADPALTMIQRSIARARRLVQDHLEEFNERRPLGTLLNVATWGLLCEQVSAVIVETIETEGPQTPNMIRDIIDGCLEIAGLIEKIFSCPVCGEKRVKVKMPDQSGNGENQKIAIVRCGACELTERMDAPSGALMDDVYKNFLTKHKTQRRRRKQH